MANILYSQDNPKKQVKVAINWYLKLARTFYMQKEIYLPMPIVDIRGVWSLFNNPSWITFAPKCHILNKFNKTM